MLYLLHRAGTFNEIHLCTCVQSAIDKFIAAGGEESKF